MTRLTEKELRQALETHEVISDTSATDMRKRPEHTALEHWKAQYERAAERGQAQSGPIVIVLQGERPTSWNQFYAGMHWSERKQEVDRVHTLVYNYLFDYPNLSVYRKPVDITVTAYFDHHPQDASNICAKMYEDALIGLLIENDGPKWVASMKTHSRVDKENPRVEIRIEEAQQ